MEQLLNDSPENWDIQAGIARFAELEDELRRMGAFGLLSEVEVLKSKLKAAMLAQQCESATDEVSGYRAELVVRTGDVYDVEKLKDTLTEAQVSRYVKEVADEPAIKQGVKIGDLTYSKLQKCGAVKRDLRSVALYVRPAKKEADDDDAV